MKNPSQKKQEGGGHQLGVGKVRLTHILRNLWNKTSELLIKCPSAAALFLLNPFSVLGILLNMHLIPLFH